MYHHGDLALSRRAAHISVKDSGVKWVADKVNKEVLNEPNLHDVKWIYLSKALTCMKIFLYKQELLFCQGDGYLWPHCCMNNIYISHRSLYAPTYSF